MTTSLAQSRYMLDKGVDPTTADMYYDFIYNNTLFMGPADADMKYITVAWSLSALLEMAPDGHIEKAHRMGAVKYRWCASDGSCGDWETSPVDALVPVVINLFS